MSGALGAEAPTSTAGENSQFLATTASIMELEGIMAVRSLLVIASVLIALGPVQALAKG